MKIKIKSMIKIKKDYLTDAPGLNLDLNLHPTPSVEAEA